MDKMSPQALASLPYPHHPVKMLTTFVKLPFLRFQWENPEKEQYLT